MSKDLKDFISYLFSCFIWFFGNIIFGMFPYIFVNFISEGTSKKIGFEELQSMVGSGVHIFVLMAIVGSVMLDYLLSSLRLGGIDAFAAYLLPAIVLFVVSVQYLLTLTNHLPKSIFNFDSHISIAIFMISMVYSVIGRLNLKIKEDTKNAKFI